MECGLAEPYQPSTGSQAKVPGKMQLDRKNRLQAEAMVIHCSMGLKLVNV